MMAGDTDSSRVNNAFFHANGWIGPNQTSERLDVTVAPANVAESDGKGYFAVEVTSRAGTAFDPAAIEIRRVGSGAANSVGGVADADSSIVIPRLAHNNLSNSTSSLTLVELPAGQYQFTVRGEANPSLGVPAEGLKGAFQVNAYLIGDVNGDHRVDAVDREAMRFMIDALHSDAN